MLVLLGRRGVRRYDGFLSDQRLERLRGDAVGLGVG